LLVHKLAHEPLRELAHDLGYEFVHGDGVGWSRSGGRYSVALFEHALMLWFLKYETLGTALARMLKRKDMARLPEHGPSTVPKPEHDRSAFLLGVGTTQGPTNYAQ
jgi:hypothetical protein